MFKKLRIRSSSFSFFTWFSMASLFRIRIIKLELELLTDYDMLLMVEEGIRGGICHAIQRYA